MEEECEAGEAQHTLLRSFRKLTVERSPALGLPAELLGSPLDSSVARTPAEHNTCCSSCSSGSR